MKPWTRPQKFLFLFTVSILGWAVLIVLGRASVYLIALAFDNPFGFACCFVPLSVLAVGLIRSREECR